MVFPQPTASPNAVDTTAHHVDSSIGKAFTPGGILPSTPDLSSSAPVINTIESLAKGIVTTSKNKKKITIMLVGETGTGKTSLLSLLVNVMAGRTPADYDLEPHDITNEQGGSPSHSQTKSAKVYKFESANGIQITVLDTPGLADTRGFQKDKEHKDSIAAAIRDSIPEVMAVIILANGTEPRLSISTDYAITTLTSIFPNMLANNICLMFTNVDSPLSWNFRSDTLPAELGNPREFLLSNPLAMRKNFLKIKRKAEERSEFNDNTRGVLEDLEIAVNVGHQVALKMLVKLFTWLDTLEPRATTQIMSLYNQSMQIEGNFSSMLARMTQLAEKRGSLERLIKETDGIKLTVKGTEIFKSVITKTNWIYQEQSVPSVLCSEPQCYSNCQVPYTLPFTLNPKPLSGCPAFWDGKSHFDYCRRCTHHMDKHHHSNYIWFHQEEQEEYIDPDAKKRHGEATEMLKTTGISISDVQKIIENTGNEMTGITEEIGRLAESYAKLSLSGSFAGQLKKSVGLLETHLEGIRNKSDPEAIKQIEASLDQLRKKLRDVEMAADAARGKISEPATVAVGRLCRGVGSKLTDFLDM